jgi:hypothetical protein
MMDALYIVASVLLVVGIWRLIVWADREHEK